MHYKDGTEAKVGDLVKGTTYNTPKSSIHVGILLGITPGSTSCNARVLIPVTKGLGRNAILYPKADDNGSHPYITAVSTSDGTFSVHRDNYSAPDEGVILAGHKIDYTACGDLELVHRAESAS